MISLPQLIVFAVLCGFFVNLSVQQIIADESVIPQEHQWQLSGTGRLDPSGVLQVTGDGKTTSYWRSEPVALQPWVIYCYRFSVSHRGVDSSGGCLPCGIEGFTRDFTTQSNQWADESFYFRMPPGVSSAPLKVGQWESNGTFEFRNAKLEQVVPIRKEFELRSGGFWLGNGETISDGVYRFRSDFAGKGANTQSPFFFASNTTFNSNRWVFGGGSELVYEFKPIPFVCNPFVLLTDGQLVINTCYHTGGEGVVEISPTMYPPNWTELGRIDKTGTREFALPDGLFPTKAICVRIRGFDRCNFQIDKIDFQSSLQATYAETDMRSLNLTGETLFATIGGETDSPPLTLTQNNEVRIWDFTVNRPILIPLKSSRSPGEKEQKFEFGGRTYSLTTQTHPFERSDYGYVLPADRMAWEMIREGVEDYEMLYLLRDLLKQKGDQLSEADRAAATELLTVPESITKTMTEFTIDPRPILQRRTAVALMIEKLMR